MEEFNSYRLDESLFYISILGAIFCCSAHALRRAFRQPRPSSPRAEGTRLTISNQETILRHTFLQRIYHWVNAAATIMLIVSGLMIYQPANIFASGSPPVYWFLWHQVGTLLLLVSSAGHLIYESFIRRTPNPMAINREEWRRMVEVVKNFWGLSKFYPPSSKYHPAQIFFHWAVAGNILILILTGMVLWKPMREALPLSLLGLSWDFIFYNRLLHAFFSATLVGLLIGHLYFALFIKKNWPETKSIFTGHIKIHDYLDSHIL